MPPRAGKSPRAYLLWGQEELRKREALDELIEALVPPEDRELDVEYVDATSPGVSGESLLHAARDRAMFSERRIVVVQNAERLRAGRHQRTQEVLAQGLASLPDYSTLVFVANAESGDERRGKAPFADKLMAALRSAGEVRQFAALKPEELSRMVTREAADAGKKMPSTAAALLVKWIGSDSRQCLQETRKLIAFVGDRETITPRDVQAMIPAPPDDNLFRILDATMAGDRSRALSLLRQVRESGVAVQQIVFWLTRNVRQLAQAKYLKERGVSPAAEADAVPPELIEDLPRDGCLYPNTKDWIRKRLWEQAGRITWPQLQRALDRLAVMDAGTKGWDYGVEDPELALELYVASLSDALSAAR